MLDVLKIQDSINRLLVKKYPDFTVYINNVPQNFERPSFLIDFISNSIEDVNKDIVKEIHYFTITYFSNVDDYFNSDKIELQRMLIDIQNIFRKGYIKVEDRAIKIATSNGGSNVNEIYLDFQTEYFEKREEELEIEKMNEIFCRRR